MNSRVGMVIQERDRHLLRELAQLRVIDREQAKLIGGFGSTTRVNRRLLMLARAKLVKRFFLGTDGAGQKALYGISRKGAVLVDAPYRGLQRRSDEPIIADLFVQHQLAVNDLYTALVYKQIPIPAITLLRWLHFFRPIVPEIPLIPDGYVEFRTPAASVASFIEIDRGTETRKTWTQKVRNYLDFATTENFNRLFHLSSFRVLVLANSERRMHSIRKTVAPLTTKIFWFTTLPQALGDGFFQSIWFRPNGEERKALFEPLA